MPLCCQRSSSRCPLASEWPFEILNVSVSTQLLNAVRRPKHVYQADTMFAAAPGHRLGLQSADYCRFNLQDPSNLAGPVDSIPVTETGHPDHRFPFNPMTPKSPPFDLLIGWSNENPLDCRRGGSFWSASKGAFSELHKLVDINSFNWVSG